MINITTHDVLAGAYKGRSVSARALLTHASADDGATALCGKVKRYGLADVGGPEITCAACKRKALQSGWQGSCNIASRVPGGSKDWAAVAIRGTMGHGRRFAGRTEEITMAMHELTKIVLVNNTGADLLFEKEIRESISKTSTLPEELVDVYTFKIIFRGEEVRVVLETR